MIEPKFTPGPWSILFNDKTKVVLEQQGVAVFVADTYAGFTKSEEEQKANAALIAAAPEMYEGLKEIRDVMEKDGRFCRTVEAIDKLLMKARGEA
ncbi:MAG TPA: hypothetical protein K8W19_15615 [Victivallis vadensis]|nr:hypothetical protein [Victivallis vadensis]